MRLISAVGIIIKKVRPIVTDTDLIKLKACGRGRSDEDVVGF